jgi:FG-GAP-like repeat
VAVGDLTGDGIDDIVMANYGDNQVSVLTGNGNGTFKPYFDLPAGSDTYAVKLADLTGDGRLDMVTTDYASNSVSVVLNQGKGSFAPLFALIAANALHNSQQNDRGTVQAPSANGNQYSPIETFGNLSFQPPAATSTQLVALTSSAIATNVAATTASASTSASTSSGALSATATSSMGLSLGSFSSLKSSSSTETGEALLVSVKVNTYLSVPILGFGAENDEVGNGEERMPWLAAARPFGDTWPSTRFVMGLDEALRNYRGSEESPLSRSLGSSRDPWDEDLFYRHLPVQS